MPLQRGLFRHVIWKRHFREAPQKTDADAGTTIEKTCEDCRVDRTEEQLGCRRGNAEESRRDEREDDSMMVHGVSL